MNWTIFVLECLAMMAVFGILVFGMLLINPLSFISDYPPEIQERYYRTQRKEATKEALTKLMIAKKVIAMFVFLLLFAWMAHLTGAQTFWHGLAVIYGYMMILAAFDILFLDWVLFSNIKRVRLPGTENMDKEYHQKWFHVKVLFPVIPIFMAGGVIAALLMVWIW